MLHPVFMKDYIEFMKHANTLLIDRTDIIESLEALLEDNKSIFPVVEYAKTVDLHTFITTFSEDDYKDSFLYTMYQSYKDLFEYCFKEDVFDKIKDNDELSEYTELIKDFNDIQFKKLNPNPEIARFEKMKQKLNEMKGNNITFEAIYTSVLINSSTHPDKMTIYQFNKVFDRIGHFKQYDTSTLLHASDFGGKTEIHPWYSTTKEEKLNSITDKQLTRAKKLQDKGGLQSKL